MQLSKLREHKDLRETLKALGNGQTDRQTDGQSDILSSWRSQKNIYEIDSRSIPLLFLFDTEQPENGLYQVEV